jgi:hypothetical protein
MDIPGGRLEGPQPSSTRHISAFNLSMDASHGDDKILRWAWEVERLRAPFLFSPSSHCVYDKRARICVQGHLNLLTMTLIVSIFYSIC